MNPIQQTHRFPASYKESIFIPESIGKEIICPTKPKKECVAINLGCIEHGKIEQRQVSNIKKVSLGGVKELIDRTGHRGQFSTLFKGGVNSQHPQNPDINITKEKRDIEIHNLHNSDLVLKRLPNIELLHKPSALGENLLIQQSSKPIVSQQSNLQIQVNLTDSALSNQGIHYSLKQDVSQNSYQNQNQFLVRIGGPSELESQTFESTQKRSLREKRILSSGQLHSSLTPNSTSTIFKFGFYSRGQQRRLLSPQMAAGIKFYSNYSQRNCNMDNVNIEGSLKKGQDQKKWFLKNSQDIGQNLQKSSRKGSVQGLDCNKSRWKYENKVNKNSDFDNEVYSRRSIQKLDRDNSLSSQSSRVPSYLNNSLKLLKSIQLQQAKEIIQDPFEFLTEEPCKKKIIQKDTLANDLNQPNKTKIENEKVSSVRSGRKEKVASTIFSPNFHMMMSSRSPQLKPIRRLGSPSPARKDCQGQQQKRVPSSNQLNINSVQGTYQHIFPIKSIDKVVCSNKPAARQLLSPPTLTNSSNKNLLQFQLKKIKNRSSIIKKPFTPIFKIIPREKQAVLKSSLELENSALKKVGSSPSFSRIILKEQTEKQQQIMKAKVQQRKECNGEVQIEASRTVVKTLKSARTQDSRACSKRQFSWPLQDNSARLNIMNLCAVTQISLKLTCQSQQSIRSQAPVHSFSVLKKLADHVLIVLHLQTSSLYCLKSMMCSLENYENYIREYKTQSYLNHPNLVKLYGSFVDDNTTAAASQHYHHDQKRKYSVSDYSDDNELRSVSPNQSTTGSLKFYILMQYLQELTLKQQNCAVFNRYSQKCLLKQAQRQNVKRIHSFLDQILPALSCIHSEGIMHRDIKPLNIFKSHNIYKLGDFGSSTFTNSQEHIGTLDYAAPEILQQLEYGKSVDIWSLGCVIFEMYVGEAPFYDQNRRVTYKRIVEGSYELERVDDMRLRELISGMIRIHPQERIDIKDIMRCEFLLAGELMQSGVSVVKE